MYCKCCLVVCLSAFAANVYVAVLCRITNDLRFKGLRLWLGVAWLCCRLKCVFRWFGVRFCESVSLLSLSAQLLRCAIKMFGFSTEFADSSLERVLQCRCEFEMRLESTWASRNKIKRRIKSIESFVARNEQQKPSRN